MITVKISGVPMSDIRFENGCYHAVFQNGKERVRRSLKTNDIEVAQKRLEALKGAFSKRAYPNMFRAHRRYKPKIHGVIIPLKPRENFIAAVCDAVRAEYAKRSLPQSLARKLSIEETYFLEEESSGFIKIGRTRLFYHRWAQLHTSRPSGGLRVICRFLAPPGLERHLHRFFKAHKIQGEWYHPAPELLRLIAALKNEFVDLHTISVYAQPSTRQQSG